MVVNMESQSPKVETTLWVIAATLLTLAVGAQYYFASQSLLLRAIGMLVAVGAAVALVARTSLARKFWNYWQDSVVELRKVVWPTKQETIHSTIAVLVMVFIMGLVLWSIDAVLVRFMAWIIRQGAVV
jgi:preprotein translocase subunit SecE